MQDGYWASKEDEEVVREAMSRVDERYKSGKFSGHYGRISKLYQNYYGVSADASSSEISTGGYAGELSLVYVNLIRYLVQHTLSLITGQPVSFSGVPKNSDAESTEQAIVAESILMTAVRQKRLDRAFHAAVEHSLIGNEGFISVTWDTAAGEVITIDPETGERVMSGDVKVDVHSIYDITRPENVPAGYEPWKIVRTWVNKWDIAARFPEIAEEISNTRAESWMVNYCSTYKYAKSTDEDVIPMYTLYHERTPAVPDGLQCVFFSNDIYLPPGPLGYDKVPVFRMTASEILGTVLGYSPANDLLGPSDAVNSLLSVALTNELAFGVQNLQSKRGNGVKPRQLGGSVQLIEYDIEPVQPLQLTATPGEVFNSIEMYRGIMMQLLGQNDVSLGQVDSSSRLSVSAMSMLENKAISFSSVLQKNYIAMLQDVATAIIRTYSLYADVPRLMTLVGKNDKPKVISFSGGQVKDVNRIIVDLGNALLQTPTQRYDAAKTLAESGIIKTPEEYAEVIQTGNIKKVLDPATTEMINIERENELLTQGEHPAVLVTDDHVRHIRMHKTVGDSPEARNNPALIQALSEHIMEHINQAKSNPPEISAALGHTPIMVPGAPEQPQ